MDAPSVARAMIFAAAMSLLGGVCLFTPARVRDFAAKWNRSRAVKSLIESDAYLPMVRACGVVAFVAVIALLWALFSGAYVAI
jgi:hypothetical protein